MAIVNTLGETDMIGDLNNLAGLTGGAIGSSVTGKKSKLLQLLI